jgi:hypothetical protein
MELHSLIVPMGIVTYAMLWFQVLTGARLVKMNFRWHRVFGRLTIVSASIHAGLVLYLQFV